MENIAWKDWLNIKKMFVNNLNFKPYYHNGVELILPSGTCRLHFNTDGTINFATTLYTDVLNYKFSNINDCIDVLVLYSTILKIQQKNGGNI
jgi:hypothetical protein